MEFKITDYEMDDFSTMYKVEYNGQIYVCNYNGGLPRLQECKFYGKNNGFTLGKFITLTESQRSDLKDLFEDFFHFQMSKKMTPKEIQNSDLHQHIVDEYEGYFYGENKDSDIKQFLIFDESLHIAEYKNGNYTLVLGNQDWFEPNLNPLICRLFTYSKLYI
jgi:hypothetical protein